MAVESKRYEVLLSRNLKQGAKYRISIERTDRQMIYGHARGTSAQKGSLAIKRFDADAEILEMDEAGRNGRTVYRIIEFSVRDVYQSKPVLAPGEKILETLEDGVRRFETAQGKLLPGASQMLGEVFGRDTQRSLPDDEVFGTSNPQILGAIWPVDKDAAARSLEDFLRIQPGDLDGTSKLVRTKKVTAVECAEVLAKIRLRKFELPGSSGIIKKSSGEVEVLISRPVDTSVAIPFEKQFTVKQTVQLEQLNVPLKLVSDHQTVIRLTPAK